MLRVLLHWPLFSIHKTGCHLKALFVFSVKKKKSQYLPISGGYKGTKSPFNKKFLPCTFSKHVGVLVICFGGCLECSWSKPKELQRRGSKGEANQLKNKRCPWPPSPLQGNSLIISPDFSSPAPRPHSWLSFPVCRLPIHHFSSHVSSKKRARSQVDFSGCIS